MYFFGNLNLGSKNSSDGPVCQDDSENDRGGDRIGAKLSTFMIGSADESLIEQNEGSSLLPSLEKGPVYFSALITLAESSDVQQFCLFDAPPPSEEQSSAPETQEAQIVVDEDEDEKNSKLSKPAVAGIDFASVTIAVCAAVLLDFLTRWGFQPDQEQNDGNSRFDSLKDTRGRAPDVYDTLDELGDFLHESHA